eukprot:CAMPEP_0170551666 /NCGR_PEP_ID=MMETSP0211-20121228/9660_1 /TAXON_ID=311385 /ORGANISM="Pseudokeronopsis sp., Strain OXSARD2" /LENGTH=104 /DNA_ID=CAMNT_0010858989 /DNA_START=459 /DNA_END=773 /DNA_ORIENTATION=-
MTTDLSDSNGPSKFQSPIVTDITPMEDLKELIGNPKRKRDIQLRIILDDRILKGDLILKTILRQMRKHYLNEFNEFTKYNTQKRHKPDSFLIECLQDYIKSAFF